MSAQINYMEEAPQKGTFYYWWTATRSLNDVRREKWHGVPSEVDRLNNHRIFETEKEALEAAKFIRRFIKINRAKLNYFTSPPEMDVEVWYGIDMDGNIRDYTCMYYNPEDTYCVNLLSDCLLFPTKTDVINAVKLITKALEQAKRKPR